MRLREFRDKYKGDVKAALRGLQMEKLGVNEGNQDAFLEMDKRTGKRKWLASVDMEADAHGAGVLGSGSLDTGPSTASKNGELLMDCALTSLIKLH